MQALQRQSRLLLTLELGTQLFDFRLRVIGSLVRRAGARFQLFDPLVQTRKLCVGSLVGRGDEGGGGSRPPHAAHQPPRWQLNHGELVEPHFMLGGQGDEQVRFFRTAWHEARVEGRLGLTRRGKVRDCVADERRLAEHAHVLELGGDGVVERVIVERAMSARGTEERERSVGVRAGHDGNAARSQRALGFADDAHRPEGAEIFDQGQLEGAVPHRQIAIRECGERDLRGAIASGRFRDAHRICVTHVNGARAALQQLHGQRGERIAEHQDTTIGGQRLGVRGQRDARLERGIFSHSERRG